MRFIILIAISFFSLPSIAAIYQKLDNTQISYSDHDTGGMQEATLNSLEILPTSPPPSSTSQLIPSSKRHMQDASVPEIHLSGITAEETIQQGQPLTVEIISHALSNEQIPSLWLDEKKYAVNKTSVSLTDLTRGTHTIQARLMDKDGHIITESNRVKFYIHQHSELFNVS